MDEETHHPDQPDEGPAVMCARCGTAAGGEAAPATWILSVENGRREYFCDDCARSNLRAIESRLDSSWW